MSVTRVKSCGKSQGRRNPFSDLLGVVSRTAMIDHGGGVPGPANVV